MNADKMFEELGYEITDLLSGKSVNYKNKKYETSISIFDNEKGKMIPATCDVLLMRDLKEQQGLLKRLLESEDKK